MAVGIQTDIEIAPLTGYTGAEIRGVDTREPLDEQTAALLRNALYRHHVVFFEPQELDDSQQLAFAANFGEVVEPVNPGQPTQLREIFRLNSKVDKWHADTTWQERPTGAQVFRVVALPDVGGDTVFASTEVAYDRLSEPLRQVCDGLYAVHDDHQIWRSYATDDDDQARIRAQREPREHPVVRVHPFTGRRSLFVNPMYTSHIVGLSSGESASLLALLYEHILQPEHIVRYRWQVGSIGIWDNRSTWHYAVNDYGEEYREIRRISLAGEVPVGLGTPR
jgi:taurine dioxygenase